MIAAREGGSRRDDARDTQKCFDFHWLFLVFDNAFDGDQALSNRRQAGGSARRIRRNYESLR
jgi:hypothetical protein